MPREIIYDYGIFIHWIITLQALADGTAAKLSIVRTIYNVCTHYFYAIIVATILLKMAQVSISVLAIRKEWLKLKLQVIQHVYVWLFFCCRLNSGCVEWNEWSMACNCVWVTSYLCYFQETAVVPFFTLPRICNYICWTIPYRLQLLKQGNHSVILLSPVMTFKSQPSLTVLS